MLHPWVITVGASLTLYSISAPPAWTAEAPVQWSDQILTHPSQWYASPKARNLADNLLTHQSREGGWPKNTPLHQLASADANPGLANTFDNHATTLPLAFLARMITATDDPAYTSAFYQGLDYVLAAQYSNGGWPQYFPLRGGYYDHITYNDDAMVRVLVLLQDIAKGQPPYQFIGSAYRQRAGTAVQRGIDVILQSQIRQNGQLTAWCAQHDATTLAPTWARRFEPPSLSGNETVGIVRFLMSLDNPSPEVRAAIAGAMSWLEGAAIHDTRLEVFTDARGNSDRRLIASPGSPPLWARFYDLKTNTPIYMGRDSVAHADLSAIERERRMGYAYVGNWPSELLKIQYPAWRDKHGL